MHFMAQHSHGNQFLQLDLELKPSCGKLISVRHSRAAEQAMQRKDDCSRPLAQGLCGGIPHDVQDFLRPPTQTAVLSAAGFYDLCTESSCRSGCRPEKRPERGQPICGRPAWGGMTVPIPAVWHRRLYGAKKEIGGPFRERLSLFGAVCQQPFFDEVKEFLGKTKERISA